MVVFEDWLYINFYIISKLFDISSNIFLKYIFINFILFDEIYIKFHHFRIYNV